MPDLEASRRKARESAAVMVLRSEMLAEGLVERDDNVDILSMNGHKYMIETTALEIE